MHFKFVIDWFIWFIGLYLSISFVSIHLSRYLSVTFLSPAQLPWWRWCFWSMPAIYRAWGSPAAWCTIVGRRGEKGRSCWINTSPQATRRQHTSCQWLLESQPLSESTRHFFSVQSYCVVLYREYKLCNTMFLNPKVKIVRGMKGACPVDH